MLGTLEGRVVLLGCLAVGSKDRVLFGSSFQKKKLRNDVSMAVVWKDILFLNGSSVYEWVVALGDITDNLLNLFH